MMKKQIALLLATVMLAAGVTGCGIVKVVKIGQEGALTGETEFDSSQQSGQDWEHVVAEITENAKDLKEVEGGIGSDAVAVSGTAVIKEWNHDQAVKTYIVLDGFENEVQIQTGSVYTGTAIRDLQTLKKFSDFKNQTEWSEYAKSLNKESDALVVQPLSLSDDVNGKEITFVGGAVKKAGKITITVVSAEIN